MSETLKAADELGKKMIESAPSVVDGVKDISANTADRLFAFIEKETPNLFHEIVAIGQCKAVIHFVVFVFFVTVLSLLIRWCWSFTKRADFGIREDITYPPIIAGAIAIFLLFLIIIANIDYSDNYIKPFFAPRIYVLEYLRDLVKQ